MKAIKIEVNFATGVRAGSIPTNSLSLPCPLGWQYIPQIDDPTSTDLGWEIRIVTSGDTSPYTGITGVAILADDTAIETELAPLVTAAGAYKYTLTTSDDLLAADMLANEVDPSPLAADDPDFPQTIYDLGCTVAVRRTQGHVDTLTEAAARFQTPG